MADPKPKLASRPPDIGFKRGGMPILLRFLALNLGVGIGLGVAFAALLVLGNVGGLKTLIETSAEPYFAIFLLYFMCALTFGSLSMGAAVMLLPYPEPEDGKGDGKDAAASARGSKEPDTSI